MNTASTGQRPFLATFWRWLAAQQTSRELGRLSDEQLADIGLQRGQIPGLAWDLACKADAADSAGVSTRGVSRALRGLAANSNDGDARGQVA